MYFIGQYSVKIREKYLFVLTDNDVLFSELSLLQFILIIMGFLINVRFIWGEEWGEGGVWVSEAGCEVKFIPYQGRVKHLTIIK